MYIHIHILVFSLKSINITSANDNSLVYYLIKISLFIIKFRKNTLYFKVFYSIQLNTLLTLIRKKKNSIKTSPKWTTVYFFNQNKKITSFYECT